ncbi:MAG TPA: lysozyme [Pyrinomonadaceae bacterium]
MREINQAGLDLIKSFEGLVDGDPSTVNLDAYIDPVGIWTIGWGHAIVVGGEFLRGAQNKAKARALYPGGITLSQAEALLRADLMDTCRDVEAAVTVPITDNQFAALVSFTFNLGIGNLRKSTLLRLVNEKQFDAAAGEFQKWNKAGGRVLPGLTRRRQAEATLFRTP